MSGRSDTRFLIADCRRVESLREGACAERLQRLFAVELALGSRAAGPDVTGCWVYLSGPSGQTEKAKSYILALCEPTVVRQCDTDQQSVQQLLSETSRFRDSLEAELCTAILPGPSPSCVLVQGTSEAAVLRTVEKIEVAMAPPDLPQPQPSSSSHAIPRHSPASTAGSFSPSPQALALTDDDEQRERVSPHQFPSSRAVPSVATVAPTMEREEIIKRTAFEIEQKDGDVVSRGVDSSHREQTIHYFLRLNFPRAKIEAVVDSMGAWAETDDILKRLNSLHISSPRPVATVSVPRNYMMDGEPALGANATLRPVVIDGSNVAMRHGNGRVFSCRGIEIAVNWFHQRGHKEITVFVPQWRKETPRAEYPITDQEILNQLERDGTLKFTPSRRIGNKKIVCYDDRFIVRLASETNGVIVSNDNFRDLAEENEKWRKTIENRLVMFTFVNDIFMVPEDPMGKYGPRLAQLLQIEPTKSSLKGGTTGRDQAGPAVCPYGERCTFGRRCRFAHPEREGRVDPALLTSRSPNMSPAPSERRHGDSAEDLVQTDGARGQLAERGSPSGPTGQPTSHSSPQRPRTSPAHVELNYTHPQPALPHGYSQPISSEGHYPHMHQSQPPQYLGIPGAHGSSLSPPPPPPATAATPIQSSPLHSGPSAYTSHSFPIANIPMTRSRHTADHMNNGHIANGGDDFLPVGPNSQPIVQPHHPQHVIEPLPGLVPRGEFPAHVPPAQFQTPRDVYWPSSNGYGHPPHVQQQTGNSYQPQHHYDQLQPRPLPRGHHHSLARNPHDYSSHPGTGHLPQHTNTYQNMPLGPENSRYMQDPAMIVHQHNHHDYHQLPHYRRVEPPQNPIPNSRAVSMYGDLGMRLHHDRVVMADRFQSSHSSPELYHDTVHTNRSLHKPVPTNSGGGAPTINWTLFKQAQKCLPDQEDQIMKLMLQHPHADLDQLVKLIKHSR